MDGTLSAGVRPQHRPSTHFTSSCSVIEHNLITSPLFESSYITHAYFSSLIRPELLSLCLLEQSGLSEHAVAELDTLVARAGHADASAMGWHAVSCEALGAVAVADRLVRWAVNASLSRAPSDATDWVVLAEECVRSLRPHCANAILSELVPRACLSRTVRELQRSFELRFGGVREASISASSAVAPLGGGRHRDRSVDGGSARGHAEDDDDDGAEGWEHGRDADATVYLCSSSVEWHSGDPDGAKAILQAGLDENPQSVRVVFESCTLHACVYLSHSSLSFFLSFSLCHSICLLDGTITLIMTSLMSHCNLLGNY